MGNLLHRDLVNTYTTTEDSAMPMANCPVYICKQDGCVQQLVSRLRSNKKTTTYVLAQVLALDDIRNEVIGDEDVRGISGGQRKRVNVGLELVADPVMLFLDEPTSGLDSTSSHMVISALQQVLPLSLLLLIRSHCFC